MILTDTQKTQLKVVKLFAKQRGFNIVFRTSNKHPNQFTFFVYNKDVSNRYLCGFDGSFDAKEYNFEKCANQAVAYISNYINRRSI